MLLTNILFVINPISGGKSKLKIPDLIDSKIDKLKFAYQYRFTEYAGHAMVLAEEAIQSGFDVVVAVGGDGTINEVASKVMEHGKILGIIPLGSGNGLARFLRIPLQVNRALQVINKLNVTTIDVGYFNGLKFFNMAGMGFDAYISSVFAGDKSRGLKGYLQHGLREVLGYRAQTYKITIDNVIYIYKAYVVSIANSSQYGNNAHISPSASVADGLLDVCIVKEFPMVKLPVLAYEMIAAKTDRSDLVKIIKGKDILIERQFEGPIHIDGEPMVMGKELSVSVSPLSLRIITP